MWNSVNSGVQTLKKAQEYNKLKAEEAYAKKYKFFNKQQSYNNNYDNNWDKETNFSDNEVNNYNNVPHYLQYRGGMKVGGAHPSTFFGERYDPQVNFTYRGNNIDVYGQKGINLYQMRQSDFDAAMINVDPYKINPNNKQNEAIIRGMLDYQKRNEWAYYDPNVNLKAPQPKRELTQKEKYDYYKFERRNVENPYDVDREIYINKNRPYNDKIPNQITQFDKSKVFGYNHLNDGIAFDDGHKKYEYGDKPVWGNANTWNRKLEYKIDRNTVEWQGDPNYHIRKLEEEQRKKSADINEVYGIKNKYNPKDMNRIMNPYYDDYETMNRKYMNYDGPGQRIDIKRQGDINYFNGNVNYNTENRDNYNAKRNDNEQVFWKNNYDQRQYQGFNGKANYLYNDGRSLVDASSKMYQPYKVYPMDPQRFQGSNHITNKPLYPLNDDRISSEITPMSDNEYLSMQNRQPENSKFTMNCKIVGGNYQYSYGYRK